MRSKKTKAELLEELERQDAIIEAFKKAISQQHIELRSEIDHWRNAFVTATTQIID